MSALIYLDTGEIFDTDEDGFPIGDPLVTLQHGVLDDDAHALGRQMAAAPEMRTMLCESVALMEIVRRRLENSGWGNAGAGSLGRQCDVIRDLLAKATGVA